MLGPGAISGWFARALPRSRYGVLQAVGSSDPARAAAFAAEHGAVAWGTYEEILGRDDVDAVYIGTVHTTHGRLALDAIEAGKAVLCEKPATPTAAETERVLAAAAMSGTPFLEAFKTSFGPFADRVRSLVAEGRIGTVEALETSRGFVAQQRTGRLFDPQLAGGAILDVGCYPASLAVSVAAAAGLPLARISVSEASGTIGETGVDEDASARVTVAGYSARLRTSLTTALPGSARIVGSEGILELPDSWGSRTESPGELVLHREGEPDRRIGVERVDPMAAEADALSLALADGRLEVPEFTWDHTRAVARILTQWRERLG